MKKFEGIFILKEKTKKEQIDNIFKILFENIEYFTIEYKGIKNLAYSVKRHTKGNFIVTYFNATEEQRAKIELKAKDIDDILKYIVIRFN